MTMKNVALTLSLGGVYFQLSPNDTKSGGGVEFSRYDDQIQLDLRSFTGTLTVSVNELEQQAIFLKEQQEHKKEQECVFSLETTPKASNHRHPARLVSSHKKRSSSPILLQESAPPAKKDKIAECDPAEDHELSLQSQPTLLGQPSQTQASMDDDTMMMPTQNDAQAHCDGDVINENDILLVDFCHQDDREEVPPTPQENLTNISEEESKQTTQPETAPTFEPNSNSVHVESPSTSPPKTVRVSLGNTPTQKPQNLMPPCERWGHTATHIGSNKVIVYGGQTFDPKTRLPVTLNDLIVLDMNRNAWLRPVNCSGLHRQWHTASFLPDKQLLIAFGGESIDVKAGKTKTTDQVMVLDTEIMLWYPPAVSGDIPSGRSGHTAQVVGNELVVFGGVKGSKWLNTLSVLDTIRWHWTTVKAEGVAPKPRSYHSCTAVQNKLIIFGGNNADESFNSVHVLERTLDEKWRWVNPKTNGLGPKPRTGHTATLLPDQKTICITGGWDPNDDTLDDDESMIFGDAFLLDTEKWVWKKTSVPKFWPCDGCGEDGGPKRVGHTAFLSKDDELLVFAGRVPGDKFTKDFQRVRLDTEIHAS